MEGYEELYDEIQSVTNKMDNFFGNAILNETPMDKHTKHLIERLQRISNELSDTAHELEEHLAWD